MITFCFIYSPKELTELQHENVVALFECVVSIDDKYDINVLIFIIIYNVDSRELYNLIIIYKMKLRQYVEYNLFLLLL